jgi:hypothetical protein
MGTSALGSHRRRPLRGGYLARTAPQLVEDPDRAPEQRFTDLSLDKKKRLWAASDEGFTAGQDRLAAHRSRAFRHNPTWRLPPTNGNLWAAGAFPGVMRLRIAKDRVVESEHVVRPASAVGAGGLAGGGSSRMAVGGAGRGRVGLRRAVWRSFTQDDGLIWNDTDSYALRGSRRQHVDRHLGGLSHLMQPQACRPAAGGAGFFADHVWDHAQSPTNPKSRGAQARWPSPWPRSAFATPATCASATAAGRGIGVGGNGGAQRALSAAGAGPYRFQASWWTRRGAVRSPVREISFVITPQWWQSGPLRLALVLAACAGCGAGVALERPTAGAAEAEPGSGPCSAAPKTWSGESRTAAGARADAPLCRARRPDRPVESPHHD